MPAYSKRRGTLFFATLRKAVAGVGGLNFFFMDSAKLGKGIDDIVGAMAAEALVFALVENVDLGGAVGLGKDFWVRLLGLERDFCFGGIFMPARGTG